MSTVPEENNTTQPQTHSTPVQTKAQPTTGTPQPPLRLTLFTPTMAVADRLPVRHVKFQGLDGKMTNVFPRHHNATFQIAPGRLVFVENGLKLDGTWDDVEEKDVENDDDGRNPHDITPTPFLQDTVPLVLDSNTKGSKSHSFFISGGIAVKRKNDLIISALQLINPAHLDPEKVKALLSNCETKSDRVMEAWEALRILGDKDGEGVRVGDVVVTGGNCRDQSTPPDGLFHVTATKVGVNNNHLDQKDQNDQIKNQPSTTTQSKSTTATTTSHQFFDKAHPSMEFALYSTGTYVTSISNDVAIALDTTLNHYNQMMKNVEKLVDQQHSQQQHNHQSVHQQNNHIKDINAATLGKASIKVPIEDGKDGNH